jgi:hypothetical protein
MRTSIGVGIGCGLSGGGAPWTPKRLGASLALWLRADKGVFLNGSNVAAWADQSGNGRDFSQGTASRQPTWSATALGGQPAVVFDGANDIFSAATLSALSTSADTFIVMKCANDPALTGFGACWQIASLPGTEDYVPFYLGRQIYCGIFSTARKATVVVGSAGYFAAPRIFSVYSKNGEWKMSTDGVERFATATNTFSSTGTIALGGDPEQSFPYHGSFAEVIIASPSLTAPQRAQVHTYLGKRYGIVV